MSSRVFQSIVLQMKECTDRVIGVIDDQGTVVSCNQLTWIGEKWEGAASALNVNESAVVIYGDKTFKPLVSRGSHYDYAAFVQGSDEQAKLICSMVTVALNSAKAYYEEKHDKTAFVKAIISDNILLGDIYVRAKELHFASEALRAVFLVRQVGSAEIAAVDVVQSLFSDSQEDFVISINETDIAIVKQLAPGTEKAELLQTAQTIEQTLRSELFVKTVIGISTSGNSANVVNAIKVARACGKRTLGLTGAKPGQLDSLCDIVIKVPETETYKIQELHLPVYHYLCAALEQRAFGNEE